VVVNENQREGKVVLLFSSAQSCVSFGLDQNKPAKVLRASAAMMKRPVGWKDDGLESGLRRKEEGRRAGGRRSTV